MLTEEQIQDIKKQLIVQIDTSFPEDKKQEAIGKVNEMGEEELEDFLKKNKLIKNIEENPCIFCSIVSEKIPSYKLGENKEAFAVLEINPISRGHVLVLPKKHIKEYEQIPNQAHSLAKKLSKKIKAKLKPKKTKIFFSNFMGHEAINILPIYKEETENSSRKKADEKDLEKLKEILKEEDEIKKTKRIKKVKTQKIEKIENSKGNIWLPRRIP
ncbi:MAG: HIT domain-containing protein [archaeon]